LMPVAASSKSVSGRVGGANQFKDLAAL